MPASKRNSRHRQPREGRDAQERADLKRENQQLRREVARLRKENERLQSAADEVAEELEQRQHQEPEKCPRCGAETKDLTTPSGKTVPHCGSCKWLGQTKK